MEVEITLTPEDLAAFEKHWRQSTAQLVNTIRLGVLVVVFGLLLLGLLTYFESKVARGYFQGMVTGCMLAALLSLWSMRVALREKARFAKEPHNRWLFEPYTLRIDANGISANRSGSLLSHTWDRIWRIDTTADHCFLYFITNSAHIVPKRCFPDEIRFQQFVIIARLLKEGRPIDSIMNSAVWKMPRRPAGLFDAESSY